MIAVTRFELRKISAQKRSWSGFLAVFMINALFALAFYLRNQRAGTKPVHGYEERLVGEFINAFVYTQTILAPCMYMLFPMVLSVIGAHILAGEIESGGIRLELCRSVSRWQVLLAKYLSLCCYSLVMLVALLGTSYAVSALLFAPSGDMLIPGPVFGLGRVFQVYSPQAAPGRILLSYALAYPMLMSVAAMALMFSMVTRHFTSAAILTSTVYFCSYIVTGIPLLSSIHPFMPTRYLPFWKYALVADIPWQTLGTDAGWTFCFTAAYLSLAIALFARQDL